MYMFIGSVVDPDPVPEFIDPENKPKPLAVSVIENERFGLFFAKTGSINSGTDVLGPPGSGSIIICTDLD
jgi:hypothetical protein